MIPHVMPGCGHHFCCGYNIIIHCIVVSILVFSHLVYDRIDANLQEQIRLQNAAAETLRRRLASLLAQVSQMPSASLRRTDHRRLCVLLCCRLPSRSPANSLLSVAMTTTRPSLVCASAHPSRPHLKTIPRIVRCTCLPNVRRISSLFRATRAVKKRTATRAQAGRSGRIPN